MRRWFLVVAFLVVGAVVAWAGTSDTSNTIPSSNSTFLADLQAFLRGEDAARFVEQFTSFVVSGCTHGTEAGLTGTPTTCIAYPGGYRATETGSIVYPDAETIYVIVNKLTTGNAGTYTRVAGTHYLIDSTSASEPTLPADSARLMTVTTAGGAITAVTDRRTLTPVTAAQRVPYGSTLTTSVIGDLLYSDAAGSWARLAGVATGQVLKSGGVATAPSWGALPLTTHVTGTLPIANGGTQTTTAPGDGKLLIGKTDGTYAVANLTAGSGITINNGNGTIEVIAVTTTGVAVLDKVTTDTTVSNTASETTVYTKSITGGTIAADDLVRLTLLGSCVNTSGSNRDLTIRLKYGATTVATGIIRVRNNLTGACPITAYLSNEAATNAQQGLISAIVGGGSGSGTYGEIGAGQGQAAEDSTTTLNLVVTVQWNAAASTLTYVMRRAIAEQIP